MWGYYIIVFSAVLCTYTAVGQNQCGQDGYTYPDKSSCNHYYKCSGGNPTRMSCPFMLVWNCNSSTCQRNMMAGCCPDDPLYKLTHFKFTFPPMPTFNPRPMPKCRNNWKMPVLFRCGEYKQCVNGTWVLKQCPSGQRYRVLSGQCKTAYFGRCATKKTTTTGTTTTTPTTTTTTTPTTTTTTTPTTTTPTTTTTTTPTTTTTTTPTTTTGTTTTTPTTTKKPIDVCPGNFIIPDVFSCPSYYQCSNNKIVKKTCPSGTYWNCWSRNCTSKRSPLCCNALSWPTVKKVSCPTNGVLNSVPLSCTSYYECVSGYVEKKKCPNYQAFDSWSKTCMSPLKARCGLKPGLTVCTAWFNGTLPFLSINFDLSVVCPKW